MSLCSCPLFKKVYPSEDLAETMSSNKERSYIMIKPDGVQRGFIGRIISRFEDKGFKLVGLKMMVADEELLNQHYAELKVRLKSF